MPLYPKNTMNLTAPQRDAPVAVRVHYYELDSKKTVLPGEVSTKRPSDPIRVGIHQERNLITYVTHTR
jgi:hypothetical protein